MRFRKRNHNPGCLLALTIHELDFTKILKHHSEQAYTTYRENKTSDIIHNLNTN
uniref:Uncharacterized protein n=1 Tax=Arundo donax TaxID=35708 RepID=A0A0A8ZYG4_ARUDO